MIFYLEFIDAFLHKSFLQLKSATIINQTTKILLNGKSEQNSKYLKSKKTGNKCLFKR